MTFLSRILIMLKKIFIKNPSIKMIESSAEIPIKRDKINFIESLKVKTKKRTVETLICDGDGLGIQKKISY